MAWEREEEEEAEDEELGLAKLRSSSFEAVELACKRAGRPTTRCPPRREARDARSLDASKTANKSKRANINYDVPILLAGP